MNKHIITLTKDATGLPVIDCGAGAPAWKVKKGDELEIQLAASASLPEGASLWIMPVNESAGHRPVARSQSIREELGSLCVDLTPGQPVKVKVELSSEPGKPNPGSHLKYYLMPARKGGKPGTHGGGDGDPGTLEVSNG